MGLGFMGFRLHRLKALGFVVFGVWWPLGFIGLRIRALSFRVQSSGKFACQSY